MISMIAAMSHNNVIGKDGVMPWHLPNDLKHFKKITSGHPILMGRKTFQSIGKPLPNRRNIVLTGDRFFQAAGIEVIHSLQEVESLMNEAAEFFVIGGATIYEQLMDMADRLYITKIDASFAGDTYFPLVDDKIWYLVDEEAGILDDKNIYQHSFYTYERRK